MDVIRYENTCKVKMSGSTKEVEAVVQDFTENSKLSVILNKSVKLNMKWNGRVYEGRSAGMDFESNGPKVTRTQTGIRG